MRCPEFLTLYSAYRDGDIFDLGVMRRVQQHLQACATCRRYDTVVRLGVAALRSTEPKGWRGVQLDTVADQLPKPALGRYAGVLVVLAALTLLVWEGRGVPDAHDTTARPAGTAPSPMAIVTAGVPFVRFVDRAARDPTPQPGPVGVRPTISSTVTLYQATSDR